ncbi:MAG: 16S rRNA (guanine(527)-N(7))-methyltransferase RsmG [Cyclobacteriaceae bacterium]
MDSVEIISRYFPKISETQLDQFHQLGVSVLHWNDKINVISRKDTAHIYLHHILHSLAIAKVIQFKPGTRIVDIGTGGGFPGIPLAIMFPDCEFHLVDSIGKKIKVVNEICTHLKLDNVRAEQTRVEQIKNQYDFVTGRAVTKLPKMLQWVANKIAAKSFNSAPNGMLYLKGGEFDEELDQIKKYHKVHDISSFFKEPFFETKKVVYIKG